MLPHDERILLQVRHIVERRWGVELKHEPADMSMEKTLADAVRVIVVIDIFVVIAMFASPEERRVFERRGAKDQRTETNDPVRLKSKV